MDIIIMVLTIILDIISIFYFRKKSKKVDLIKFPIFWLIVPWLVCLSFYSLLGLKFQYELKFSGYIYILLFLLSFCSGYYIISKRMEKNIDKYKKAEDIKEEKRKIDTLKFTIISTISMLIYTIILVLNNDIIVGTTRNIELNGINTILLAISSVSLIVWLYELIFAITNGKIISLRAIICAIVFNIPGILISGRDALSIFIIATFIGYIYAIKKLKSTDKTKYKKMKSFSFKIIIIALILLITYLILLTNNRYGKNDNSALLMFEYAGGVKFPKYLINLYYHSGIGKVIINLIFYYSSQFTKLQILLDNYHGPYLLGLYQLHIISRHIPDNFYFSFKNVLSQIKAITTAVGLPGTEVLWGTTIEYFIYDYGIYLTPIISLLYGLLYGYIFRKQDNGNLSIVLQIILCVGMFLTVEMSPIFDYFFVFPLIWILILNWRRKNE